MQIERRPIDILESRKATFQTQLTTWSAIESKLNSLMSAAQDIDTLNEFLVKSATSNDTDILTVTADADAAAGSHEVLINQLATNQIHAHEDGWADLDTTAVNDSGDDEYFSFRYGDTNYTLTVPDGTTLQGLVNLLNNDEDNPGVTASIINDGSGGADPYHLILAGDETGEDNDIEIINTGPNPTDLNGNYFREGNWDATQVAQNSQIRVDGFPDPDWNWPTPWIESDTNSVEGIIPGITLNLKDVSGGSAIRIEISIDHSAIKSKVNSLVTAYNDVIETINVLTAYDTENKTAAPLAGSSLARSIRTDLMSLVASNIPGTEDGDDYRVVAQAGLTMISGGLLKLDAEELEEALEDDAEAVARLFAFDSTTSSTFVSVSDYDENTVGGTYDFTFTYDADGNINEGGTNTINGENAIIHGDNLLGGANGSNVEGLLVTLTNPGGGPTSLSGTITVYTGFSVLLANKIDAMTETDGSLDINTDRINDTIDLLEDRMENYERRLISVEENYNRRFLAMEILVGNLKMQSNFLASG